MNSVRAFLFLLGWSRVLESPLLRPEAYRHVIDGARNDNKVVCAVGRCAKERRWNIGVLVAMARPWKKRLFTDGEVDFRYAKPALSSKPLGTLGHCPVGLYGYR